eukprot:354984-Chlamydomonas_euryale.AAC.4
MSACLHCQRSATWSRSGSPAVQRGTTHMPPVYTRCRRRDDEAGRQPSGGSSGGLDVASSILMSPHVARPLVPLFCVPAMS